MGSHLVNGAHMVVHDLMELSKPKSSYRAWERQYRFHAMNKTYIN